MIKEKELKKAEEEFKKNHPGWGRGELRDIDEDLRQRRTYRDGSGNFKHYTTVNFSDLDIEDEEGNLIPFEPETDKVSFMVQGDSLPKFWLPIYKKLEGLEAVFLFCAYQWEMTQEQIGNYFGVSRQYVTKLLKQAQEKIKNIKELQQHLNRGGKDPRV